MKYYLTLVLFLFTLLSCKFPFDNDPVDSSDDDPNFDITKDIIDIPKSLLPQESRSVSSSATTIYELIPEYIGAAEEVRSMVEDVVSDLIENKSWIDSVDRDTPYPVTDDPNIAEYIVKTIAGDYNRRIILNSTAGSSTPIMVIDFYIDEVSSKTRGKIIFTDTGLFSGTPTGVSLNKTSMAEVIFDGISETKSLNIHYYQPMGEILSTDSATLIGYARSLDGTVQEDKTILNNLDLGQPERISIKVTFDGEYYRVSGYSYHPGLDTMHDKNLDVFYELFNPEDQSKRHTYLFKGISKVNTDGTDLGAKLHLSFPVDTLTDTANVWKDDALGEFYSDYLTVVANKFMNDPDEDGVKLEDSEFGKALFMNLWIKNKAPKYTSGDSVDQTKWGEVNTWAEAIKTGIVDAADLSAANSYISGLNYKNQARNIVKRDDIYLLAEMYNIVIGSETAPFTAETWTAFKDAFYSVTATDYNKTYNLIKLSASSVNSYLNDSANTNSDKEGVLFLYKLTDIIDELVPITFTEFSVLRSELETFLSRADLDSGAQSFADTYKSLNYIVNPALYHYSNKFLGTYNPDKQEYYGLSGGVLALTQNPSTEMSAINAYDSSTIDALIPATEKNYAITFP